MDPVSALSVAGVALQLVGLCVTVSQSLSTVKDKYDEVGKTIRGIRRYCKVIEFAVRKVQVWIQTTLADSDVDVSELAALQSLLLEYTEVIQDLKDDVDKIHGPADKAIIRYGQKIKFIWKQDTMQQHLQELHYLSSAFHFLLDATKLPLNQLRQVVNQTREHSQSISSSRCSLTSFRNVEPSTAMAVQFTFNEILASSAVYKRAEAYALAASIDTDAESSPGVSPLYHDNVALAVRKASPFKDFRVPPRNQGFKGQEDILKALHDSLERKEHVPKVRTCVLWGFGGVGKSEIVREYAYRQREQCSYDVVWWVRAESRTSIAISYSSFSETLGLTTSTNPSDQVRLVKKWLASTESSWLLVFDDFDDEITQLESLLPGATEGYGSVILTTRRRFNWPGIPSIEVAPLTMDEGASFLLGILAETSIISNETMAAARNIANILGGLPLALAQIREFLKQRGTTLIQLERKLRDSKPSLSLDNDRDSAYKYGSSIIDSFSITASTISSDAMILLGMLSFLNPDGIDERLIISESATDHQRALNLKELSSYSLVTIRKDKDNRRLIYIHRFVQKMALSHLRSTITSLQDAFQLATNSVREHIPDTSKIKISHGREFQLLEPFFRHVISIALTYRFSFQDGLRPSIELSKLLVESAACMCRAGYLEGPRSILPVAIEILEKLDIPADNDLYKKIVTMQGFISDWTL